MTMMTSGAEPCIKCGTEGGFANADQRRPNRTKGLCQACYLKAWSQRRATQRQQQKQEGTITPTVVIRSSPDLALDSRFLAAARDSQPPYVLSQQARCVKTSRDRIAYRESMSTADYWRDAQPIPVGVKQRAHVWQHIMGIHGYPGMTESTCGVEPHVRAPLTLEAEAA